VNGEWKLERAQHGSTLASFNYISCAEKELEKRNRMKGNYRKKFNRVFEEDASNFCIRVCRSQTPRTEENCDKENFTFSGRRTP
jgi:hypothetical protein